MCGSPRTECVRRTIPHIYVARTSNNRVIMACHLLSLAATVWSFAQMPLRLPNRNKMLLWPGCEGCAVLSLPKKNVWSVRFVVKKRRDCCCNLSADVALNAQFTMNRICTKNNTTYMWREQAIIEWSRCVISSVACCHSVKLCAHAAWAFWLQHYNMKNLACGQWGDWHAWICLLFLMLKLDNLNILSICLFQKHIPRHKG